MKKLFSLFFLLLIFDIGVAQFNRPNIILVVADDVGYGDIQFYYQDGKIETPTLNMMAEQGTAFTDAHSPSSVCAPSRYSILTGNYPWRGKRENGTWNPIIGSQIKKGQTTLAQALKNGKYRTGFFGKWNLGGSFFMRNSNQTATSLSNADFLRGYQGGPIDYGFDNAYYMLVGIQKPPYVFFRNKEIDENPRNLSYLTQDVNNIVLNEPGLGSSNWSVKEAPRKILEELNYFVEDSNQPFFITYYMTESHWPWDPLDSLMGNQIKGKTGISKRSDCVYQIDISLKIILNKLKDKGILDNTIIIFTSDNGGNSNYASEVKANHKINGDWFSGKGSIYEGGNRVPLIIYTGDNFKYIHDKFNQSLIGLNDLFSTILKICKLDQAIKPLDSHSFYENEKSRSELLYQANLHQIKPSVSYHAIRENNLVLTFDSDYKVNELFDLDKNISQNQDQNLLKHSEYFDKIEYLKCKFYGIRLYDKNLISVNNKYVRASPNPFSKSIHISGINGSFNYRVLSLNGAILLSETGKRNRLIDLSSINEKVVLLELSSSCTYYTIKLIKR